MNEIDKLIYKDAIDIAKEIQRLTGFLTFGDIECILNELEADYKKRFPKAEIHHYEIARMFFVNKEMKIVIEKQIVTSKDGYADIAYEIKRVEVEE